MAKIIVQAVSSWEIQDKNMKGLTVNYIDPSIVQDDDTIGIRPLKTNLDAEELRKFPVVPGVYDAEFGMRATSKGKIEMYLRELSYIKPFEFVVD